MKFSCIRSGKPDDIVELYAILKQSPFSWEKRTLSECFGEKYLQWVLCDSASTIIAFIIIHDVGDNWEIMQIAVDQRHQRKGYATQLLRYVIRKASKLKIKKIQLEVRASNSAAIFLYKKLGFVQTGLRKNYYVVNGNSEDALLFDYLFL